MDDNAKMWLDAAETPFAIKCKNVMQDDPRRLYHNWDHVLRCLWHAGNTFRYEFDPVLADTILSHDVIYDGKGVHEARSATWMYANYEGDYAHEIAMGIMKTVEHLPSADNRMVLIDLANFLNEQEREDTRQRVIDECVLLYGKSRESIEEANVLFLRSLRSRLGNVIGVPVEDHQYFSDIRAGIKSVIRVQ